MKLLSDVGLFYRRSIKLQVARNPVWLIVNLSTPVLYIALFTPLLTSLTHSSSGVALQLFLPGVLALMAFAAGSNLGFNTIFQLQAGIIERFRVTPTSRFAILVGPIMATLSTMLFFDLILILAGMIFGFTAHWLGLLVLAVLLCLLATTFAAFSIAMAIKTKEITAFSAVITGIYLPILLLAGVLLPVTSETAPSWMLVLAHLNPLYYVVSASRALALGDFTNPAVWQAFAVLIPLCAGMLTWATSVFRRAVA